ncbi:ABC-2 type transport system permease protein [Desulfobotulus alkaliphilus]|uniref:ABC-2 type transport system permease protein n=1 Tax=Desulfobotulus alkaliphilus TaxID=622671 RepID=A0A562RRR9_9BACT|nr:ABC transporter permease subunit [Desulfobotulus alkaliphilus]TWI71234.1 ABC-2 type transport system permease protein [Desulfobotulus alkaliphilus]
MIPSSFHSIRAVFKRELMSYFITPVAYVFLVIFLILQAFFTFQVSRLFESGQADLRPFFDWHPWIFLFLIPAVSMRLWSDEQRQGTLELLLTLPLSLTAIILGKFLAAWTFIALALFLTFPVVLTVLYLGNPDLSAIFCAYIGSFFMAGAFLSVGIFTSALTRSQVISFVLTLIFCLLFVLAGYPPVMDMLGTSAPQSLASFIASLSFLTHFNTFAMGIFDLRDLVYYLSVIVFMLTANGILLVNRRS